MPRVISANFEEKTTLGLKTQAFPLRLSRIAASSRLQVAREKVSPANRVQHAPAVTQKKVTDVREDLRLGRPHLSVGFKLSEYHAARVNGADLIQDAATIYADRRARRCRKCYKFSMQRSPRW